MTFATFIIVCIVGLLGYYGYLIFFATDKSSNTFDDKVTGFPDSEISIDPPITVSIDMVTFHPTVQGSSGNGDRKNALGPGQSENRYGVPSPKGEASSEYETFVAYSHSAEQQGKTLFSSIII